MDNGRGVCTFMWRIENYSYCWHPNGIPLNSPVFIDKDLEGTAWNLKLFPRGETDHCRDHISLFFCRSAEDEGPEEFSLKYELSFLAADGSTLVCGHGTKAFKKGNGHGFAKFQEMNEVLLSKKTDYLPQDTLSVCCKFQEKEGNVQSETQIYFQTRIGVEHISFRSVIENFCALKSNEKKIAYLKISSQNQNELSCELYLSASSCCPEKIMAEIKTSDFKHRVSKLRICLLDVSGKEVDYGEVDNRIDFTGKLNRNLALSLTRQDILKKKSEYLPDDKLSLSCECSFSTGVECEKIEKAVLKIPLIASSKHDVDDSVVKAVDSGSQYEITPKQTTKKLSVLKCLFVAVFACFFGVCVSYLSENLSTFFSIW